MFATKPGTLSLIPGRHTLKRTDSHKLSSDLQEHIMTPMYTNIICVHTSQINTCKITKCLKVLGLKKEPNST